ncbi:hypothetical protein IW262DRAFT_900992 [Armillaria fumosa]|nr:hypothetical protein IW262DRAFT_900992 [Armillaria fumosa]
MSFRHFNLLTDNAKKTAVEFYFATQLRKLLSRHFTEEERNKFHLLQAEFGVLISGWSGMRFFECVGYPDTDLALYVEHKHCHAVGQFLLVAGYTFHSSRDAKGRVLRGPYRRAAFQRLLDCVIRILPDCKMSLPWYCGRLGFLWQRYPSSTDHLQEVSDESHTFFSLNHSHAYSLFPKATFDQKRALIITTSGSGQNIVTEVGSFSSIVPHLM